MANMKNAKKKVKQIVKSTQENVPYLGAVKNSIKETEKAITAGNKEQATSSLAKVIKNLDNAKVKGLVHKNKVAREKSRLTKKVNAMETK